MICKCNLELIQAWGLPTCGPIPERIIKMFFTTDLRELALNSNTAGIGELAPSFPYETPWLYEEGVNNTTYSLWSGIWALSTPLLDQVESDRAEGVREEIGGNSYFVKYANRSFTVTMAKKPVEMGELIAKLRCLRNVGVFLLDSNGILWGRRGNSLIQGGPNDNLFAETVRPIAINPQTIDERMTFAGENTVQKWIFSFQLAQDVLDYELVPVYFDKNLINYQPPMALSAKFDGDNEIAFVYAHFAVGSRKTLLNVSDLPIYPKAHDASGPIANDTTTWTVEGDGYKLGNIPSGATHYKYTATQLRTATDSRYDLFNLKIIL